MTNKLLSHFQSKVLCIEERIEKGKAIRFKYPRANLGDYKIVTKRPDPVLILEKQGKTRLAELLPIRYAHMLASPFSFLTGAVKVAAKSGRIKVAGKEA